MTPGGGNPRDSRSATGSGGISGAGVTERRLMPPRPWGRRCIAELSPTASAHTRTVMGGPWDADLPVSERTGRGGASVGLRERDQRTPRSQGQGEHVCRGCAAHPNCAPAAAQATRRRLPTAMPPAVWRRRARGLWCGRRCAVRPSVLCRPRISSRGLSIGPVTPPMTASVVTRVRSFCQARWPGR